MIQQGIPIFYGERQIVQPKKNLSSISVISLALCGDVKMSVESLPFFLSQAFSQTAMYIRLLHHCTIK